MKRNLLSIMLFFTIIYAAFAQRLPTVAILPFEAGNRATPDEAASVTREIIAELTSWGGINIIQDTAGAEYIVRGSISRVGTNTILTAETIEARSDNILNLTREQAATLQEISIPNFCAQVVENVPFPNYLIGTWQSTLNMPDGPVVCIIEFRSNRSIHVERYDTWEHRHNNSLRYEGYGGGTYTYAGFFIRRTINVGGQAVQIDAMTNIHLTLEETLPEQTNVNQNRLGIVFNADKTSFDIVGGHLPCGRNYDGDRIYPQTIIGFTRFTKLR